LGSRLQGTLRDLVEPAHAGGVPVEILLDEGLNVAQTVEQHAQSLSVDLITIGTHGWSGGSATVAGIGCGTGVTHRPVSSDDRTSTSTSHDSPLARSASANPLPRRLLAGVEPGNRIRGLVGESGRRASHRPARDRAARGTWRHATARLHDRQRVVARAREQMRHTLTDRIRQTAEIDELFLVGRSFRRSSGSQSTT
jgi:hypothetical protein